MKREPEVAEEGIMTDDEIVLIGGCMNTPPDNLFEWEDFDEEMEEEDEDKGDEFYFSDEGDEDLISSALSVCKEKES